MPTIGVAVAIIDNDHILLIKREDFEVWGLPGCPRRSCRGITSALWTHWTAPETG